MIYLLLGLIGLISVFGWIIAESHCQLTTRISIGLLAILFSPFMIFVSYWHTFTLREYERMQQAETRYFIDATLKGLKAGKTDFVIQKLQEVKKAQTAGSFKFWAILGESALAIRNAEPGAQPDAGTGRKLTP
jgi:hypothetical protein